MIHQLLVYGLYIYWATIQIQYRKIQKLYNRDHYLDTIVPLLYPRKKDGLK